MNFKLFIIIIIFLSSSSALAKDFISGNEYTISVNYDERFIYKWEVSNVIYEENNKNVFIWTAPEVNSPTEIIFSVKATDKICGCQLIANKTITILPRGEDPAQINGTTINDTLINDTPIDYILINDTPIDDTSINDTTVDDIPSDDSSLDNFVTTDNASLAEIPLDSTIPPEKSEAGAGVESEPADERDPNNEIWSIPLNFGEGITVEVIAVESGPGTFAASVESVEGLSDILEEDISQSLTDLENNSTPPSAPDTNQTTVKDLNQTKETEDSSAKIAEASSEMLQLNQSGMENTDNDLVSSEIEPGASEMVGGQPDPEPITVSSEQLADETMLSNATSVMPDQPE